jgi:ribosome recycling factor
MCLTLQGGEVEVYIMVIEKRLRVSDIQVYCRRRPEVISIVIPRLDTDHQKKRHKMGYLD